MEAISININGSILVFTVNLISANEKIFYNL